MLFSEVGWLGQVEFILFSQIEAFFWGFSATVYVYGGLYKKETHWKYVLLS